MPTRDEKAFVLEFLNDLSANNSKDWMDEHRTRYMRSKKIWLAQIQEILDRLGRHDVHYLSVEPKKTLSRITNNRMFHPDKPVYKDWFSCQPAGKEANSSLMFFMVGANEAFVGGGFWKPEKEAIDLIREAIDYDGEVLKDILSSDPFKSFFGGLGHDPDKLKTSPQQYSIDHPHIDLLRHKNFIAQHAFGADEFLSDDFTDLMEEAFLAIRPFSEYLTRALSMAEK